MTLPDLKQLEAIVKTAAEEILLPGFGKYDYTYKSDGSIITPADEAMQLRLAQKLTEAWPQYAILGEEMGEAEQRKAMASPGGYWCIDPLDGTNNYATGMPFFAVSIALIIDRKQELGFILDPMRDEVFTAIKGEGAALNGERLKAAQNKTEIKRAVAEIDMKRLSNELAIRLVTEEPFSSQRNIGSSALDWCWLAASRYNVYLHGGQKLWDYAAGNLIVHEAGGQSIALDGEPVFRGRYEDRSALASLDGALFDYWKQWVGIK
ncbi:MAG: inositol monophosphatase [Thiotrichales bacterium]|nr:MAG: inositol monophosphatase [Thiotrichales bacterium]